MLPDHEYHQLAVVDVVDETADTRSFVLEIPPELERDVRVHGRAVLHVPRRRSTASRSSARTRCRARPTPATRSPTTVKRVPGGRMSNWMNDALAPGSTIDVMRPTGLFVLHDRDVPIVAFAGGSGITPVISIIKSALATTTRPIRARVREPQRRLGDLRATSSSGCASEFGDRLSVHHHLDSERGFLEPAQCAALVGEHAHADFYICGPGPYMDTVEAGLALLGVAPDAGVHRAVHRPRRRARRDDRRGDRVARVAGDPARPRASTRCAYHAGDTVLETARRGGLRPPFSCEAGNCATCMAHLDKGSVTMRVNNALSADELDEGWVLTCQSIPTSAELVVELRRVIAPCGASRLRARDTARRGTRACGRAIRCARRDSARAAARERPGR